MRFLAMPTLYCYFFFISDMTISGYQLMSVIPSIESFATTVSYNP